MADHLIRKLENFVLLSQEEKDVLRRLASLHVTTYAAGQDIVLEGERPCRLNIVLGGFACRYKLLEDGRRQIVGLFVPGDLCDARMFVLKQMDHSIAAVTEVQVAKLTQEEVLALSDASPRITRALWWNTLVEEGTAREWVLNLGQRSAYERMAHLFCEFFTRMQAVGLTDASSCDMPLTQSELAEALGITPVHANRMLQAMRAERLIALKAGRLDVLDLDRLMAVAMFNPNYLHLDRSGAAYDANDR